MRQFVKHVKHGIILFSAAIAVAGCSSGYTTVVKRPPDNYQKLGQASGTACGSLLVYATAWNFIPVMLTDRVERAYADALHSVPGATSLTDVTLDEFWFWWILGHTKCVTISGEAVR